MNKNTQPVTSADLFEMANALKNLEETIAIAERHKQSQSIPVEIINALITADAQVLRNKFVSSNKIENLRKSFVEQKINGQEWLGTVGPKSKAATSTTESAEATESTPTVTKAPAKKK